MYFFQCISSPMAQDVNDLKANSYHIPFELFRARMTVVSTCSTTSTQHSDSRQLAEPSHWDSLNSPLIQDEGDGKTLKLRFDVSQYTPEEIVVKTVDNKLLTFSGL
ncbi:hypothetical protein O3G_MSEX013601 [Manduca sexta]|uniref:SHSP domain-containing protein n=1 Tax=Manduca sexta TaxID=7130 RepID=A0A921ZT65_MANSE|nr:hypothetical protein O3G_MSEX013601 [Manduca sexta]